MTYSVESDALTLFEEREEDLIDAWLNDHGHEDWDFPTVCGSCCGFYVDEYWLTLSPAEVEEFNEYARLNNIGGVASAHGIRAT